MHEPDPEVPKLDQVIARAQADTLFARGCRKPAGVILSRAREVGENRNWPFALTGAICCCPSRSNRRFSLQNRQNLANVRRRHSASPLRAGTENDEHFPQNPRDASLG